MFGLGLGRLGVVQRASDGGSSPPVTPSNALLMDGTPLLIDGGYILFT